MEKKEWVATCKRMQSVVRKDASLRNYYEYEGKNCVIGGLATAASIILPSDFENEASIKYLSEFAQEICQKYPGLTLARLEILQSVNDRYKTTQTRRKWLLKKIEKWKTKSV